MVVVLGPPCSGKSTYVTKRVMAGDIVIDVDRIARALGSTEEHDHAPHHVAAALAARDAVAAHPGPGTTWLIATNRKALGHLRLPPGAEVVVLDTPLDQCLARAVAAGRTEAVLAAIRGWSA